MFSLHIMPLFDHVLFINLQERIDRLIHVSKELKRLGIQAERFNAVKMKSGAIGCTMSHIKCLEMAKSRGYPNVFICEDDITFTNPELLIENIRQFENSEYGKNWDVLIIGGNNVPPYQKVSDFCIRVNNCQTTTGYIVNAHYYDKLIENFKDGMRNLLREPENKPQYAIDIYWKRLQQDDHWYMIIPATVIQCDGYSDIEGREVSYKHLMTDIDKEWMMRQRMPNFHKMTYFNGH